MAILGLFAGPSLSVIDDKGRLAIPASLRNSIATHDGERMLCVSKHPTDDCLIAYGPDRLIRLQAELARERELAATRDRDFDRDTANRLNFGMTDTVPLDNSGRFILAAWLKDLGGLEKTVFLHGAGEYFEIWNPDILAKTPKLDPLARVCKALMAQPGRGRK